MILNLNITTVTNQDYDEIDETIKQVEPDIDGIKLKEFYSYPDTKLDSEIQTEVKVDLTAKGYTWEE